MMTHFYVLCILKLLIPPPATPPCYAAGHVGSLAEEAGILGERLQSKFSFFSEVS